MAPRTSMSIGELGNTVKLSPNWRHSRLGPAQFRSLSASIPPTRRALRHSCNGAISALPRRLRPAVEPCTPVETFGGGELSEPQGVAVDDSIRHRLRRRHRQPPRRRLYRRPYLPDATPRPKPRPRPARAPQRQSRPRRRRAEVTACQFEYGPEDGNFEAGRLGWAACDTEDALRLPSPPKPRSPRVASSRPHLRHHLPLPPPRRKRQRLHHQLRPDLHHPARSTRRSAAESVTEVHAEAARSTPRSTPVAAKPPTTPPTTSNTSPRNSSKTTKAASPAPKSRAPPTRPRLRQDPPERSPPSSHGLSPAPPTTTASSPPTPPTRPTARRRRPHLHHPPLLANLTTPAPTPTSASRPAPPQLLDCRAYELVSAANAGGYDVESNLIAGQTPFAGYPEAEGRVLYGVHDGGIPGTDHPTNRGVDPYLATRGKRRLVDRIRRHPRQRYPLRHAPFSSTLLRSRREP